MDIEIQQKQLDDLAMTWRIFNGGSRLELFFNHTTKPPRTIFAADETTFMQTVVAHNLQQHTSYFGLQGRRADLSQPGTNADISTLRWLYIDIDSVKPSKELCSSDSEKACALEAAKKITSDCIAGGYQEPILMDSGNGYWLFFRIPDIPINEENRAEIAARLKAWGAKITGIYKGQFPSADIDGGIYDLRRITKIPGTKIFNKNEAEGRPQRTSTIISAHQPIPDQKLFEAFMSLDLPAEETHKTQETYQHTNSEKLHPERITEKCYTLDFIRNQALSAVSLPHNIRLALSTVSNALDDLNHGLAFIRPILQNCPDYSEEKTRYYLQQNVGKSGPYSCEKFKELAIEHFKGFEPGRCNCQLPPHGKSKPSPIRHAYPSMSDMAEAFNSIDWNRDDSFQKLLQLKSFAGEWFQYFDSGDSEEFLRAHKQDLCVRIDTIRSLVKSGSSEEADDRSVADVLVAIAEARSTYFKDADGNVFAEIQVDNHTETHHIKGKGFQSWLRREFYNEKGKGVSAQPVSDAVLTIEAKHLFSCDQHPVFVRVGGDDTKIFIDLCNEKWEVVEISPDGYRVIQQSPVKLRRSSGMMPLPYPVEGGSLSILKDFLNLMNPDDWKLIAAFIIACGRPSGPYPILCIQGEQGSAKSTACRLIRELIDPSSTPLRQTPRESRDLMISAINSWVLAFDNMSNIPLWLSDLLCRLATGGGMSVRTNYEDMDETLFQATRPIILNGINSVTSEPDLADRSISVQLAAISEDNRKTEADIMRRFNKEKPLIFGAVCSAVSIALKNLSTTKLQRLPRMADFAIWSVAAEPAYCQPGEFMKVYSGNRQSAIDESLSSSPVMDSVVQMTEETGFSVWEGTSSELLQILNEKVGDKIQRSKSWPKEPNHLIRKLNKATPQLRSRGITIEHDRKWNRRKLRIIKGSQFTVITVMDVKNQVQPTENINKTNMTVKNNLPSCLGDLPSCDAVTVMVSSPGNGNHDGKNNNHDGNNVAGTALPSWSNTVKNQTVKVNHDGNDGNDDKFASLYTDEIIPINSADPPKPMRRYVI
jgi:hypothetical protein